jgi:hypothetical protein
VYFCGDVEKVEHLIDIIVVCDYCYNNTTNFRIIPSRQLPINIHNIGLYIDQFCESGYFDRISNDHEFQNLTESNKSSAAYQTCVYITNVKETNAEKSFIY